MTFIDPPNTLALPRKKPPAVADTPQEKQGALLTTTATLLAIVLSQVLLGKKSKLERMFAPNNTILYVLAPILKAFSDPPKIFTPT
jgi:hypothetical protein